MINALFGLIGVLSLVDSTHLQSYPEAPLASPEVQAAASEAFYQAADAQEPAAKLVKAAENLWSAHIDGRESETEYEWLRVEISRICGDANYARRELEAAEAGEPNPNLLFALSLIEQIERSSCPATP